MAQLPTLASYIGDFFDAVEYKTKRRVNRDNAVGGRWDAFAAALARMFLRANTLQLNAFDDHTRNARGNSLDTFCARRGPLVRFDAKAARGTIQLHRGSAGAGAGNIPKGFEYRVPNADDGKSYVYRVDVDTSCSATALDVALPVTAEQTGTASNVGDVAGGITATGQIVGDDGSSTPWSLWDTTLLPQSASIGGGTAQEQDEELLARQILYEQGREKGTDPAIALGALLADGCKHVVLAKHYDSHLGGQGVVYAADANWNSPARLLADVAASLESWRGTVALSYLPIATTDLTITAVVTMARSIARYDGVQLRSGVLSRILDYFEKRQNPYEYSLALLAGRMERAHDEITSVAITSPATSVPSPIAPSAVALAGYPNPLVRYRVKPGNVNLTFIGPS